MTCNAKIPNHTTPIVHKEWKKKSSKNQIIAKVGYTSG
jgi:hypothetical protein